jgi:hypothetical protein
VRDDLRIHIGLADAPRDQLRVLRTVVDDQHGAGRCRFHWFSLVAAVPLLLRSGGLTGASSIATFQDKEVRQGRTA